MRTFLFCCMLLCAFAPSTTQAEIAPLNHDQVKQIPILYHGRIQPLDSVARHLLARLHGETRFKGAPAINWLVDSLFRPDIATQHSMIQVNERVASMLELPPSEEGLYAYQALAAAYEQQQDTIRTLVQKGSDALNKQEQQFWDLYLLINEFSQVTRALTLVLPSKLHVPASYENILTIPQGSHSYFDFIDAKPRILADAKRAVAEHGDALGSYSQQEQDAARLAFHLMNIDSTAQKNVLFRVMPGPADAITQWRSPWNALQQAPVADDTKQLLRLWQQLAEAYFQHDPLAWQVASRAIQQHTTGARATANWQLALETHYHHMHWLPLIIGCYVLCCVLRLLRAQSSSLRMLATSLLHIGVITHLAVIVVRMLILQRPPVSTLYESVLFVSLAVVLFGLMIDRKSTTHEGSIVGGLLGALLLAVSGLFAEQGNTLGVVIAVLNTNFWLATHVICITIGYACCLLTGTLAHIQLVRPSKMNEKRLRSWALISLLFTAIGTILGGIWADQSWGRFWGWDPKENGALTIVIWLVWILHGRMTGHFHNIGLACALALTNIIVALSWFGVNLLNVGLHSYGFTDAAAWGLAAFCIGELVLITLLATHATRKERRHAS